MESKKINALITAIECGSLTSAADTLGYTQSGLTHMMKSLEDDLGVQLLVRSKAGVSLTEDGEKLLPGLKEINDRCRELYSEAAGLHGEKLHRIKLGTYSSVARQWLPQVLSDYKSIYPNTEVEIYVGGMPDIYERLNKGALDCAFVSYQESLVGSLKYIHLRNDPLLAVLPNECPAVAESFSMENFSGCNFIMPSDGFELDIAPVFGNDIGGVMKRVQRINFDDAALVSMVEHGLGLTVLSQLVMQDMHAAVKTVSLNPPAYRYLGIAVSEKNYEIKSIKSFVDSAKKTVERLYEL